MFRYSKLAAMSIALTLGLAACGGGGGGSAGVTGPSYSGSTSPASVDSANAEALGKGAADAAAQSVSSDPATGSSLFAVVEDASGGVPSEETTQLTLEIIHKALDELQAASPDQAQNSVVGATITAEQLNVEMQTNEFCGGSISIPDNTDFESTTLDMTMTFNNLCYNDGVNPQVTMNGTVRLIESETSSTVIFSNFTMTAGGETYTLNASTTCDAFGDCTVDFAGTDGNTYRVGSWSVTGDSVSGYHVNGDFYHPEYGSVTVSTDVSNPLTFNCAPNPQPGSGILNFMGTGGTQGSIEFLDCSSYEVCYDENMGAGPQCSGALTW